MYIIFIAFFLDTALANLIVSTDSGPIQGVSSLAENVEAFLGIPYAEPPVGDLRFAKTVPKRKWSSTFDASNFGAPCTQFSLDQNYYFMPNITNMSEDCLYLNIWTPHSLSTGSLKPVIVFLHPGAFVTGSSTLKAHDGSHFSSRGNVVVVTINYRLGTFGYLLAYIEEADGNMGMYDQIMAMKWVKDNVKFFGGDPENIVLMGSSAGAISISAHMISPLSKNLFNRAIIQSGSAVHPLFMDENASLFQTSQAVANLVGCTNETFTLENDPKSVVKCLKDQPKEAFVKAEKLLLETKPALFYPRVNDDFLPKSSVALFREGKFRKDINVMIGFTKEEGTLLLMAASPEFFGNYGQNYENNMNKLRALSLSRAMLMSLGQSKSSEITSFYSNQLKSRKSIDYIKMLANIVGDYTIACGTVFLADFLSVKGNTVYFYKFDFQSASSPMEDWIGTSHLDELQYIFGNPYHDNFTADEIELSLRMMDRWSAFARTGNPNISGHMPWYQYHHKRPLYLNFGQEEESIRMTPNKLCEIWRKRFNSLFDSELIQFLSNSERNTMNTRIDESRFGVFQIKGHSHV